MVASLAVAVSNDGNLSDDWKILSSTLYSLISQAAAFEALERGRKGQYMPDEFSFNGRDNLSLDYINRTWQILT